MRLRGSCQCGKVGFSVESETPYPFMYCYCSICRKTCGVAFGCNVMGRRETLRVTGRRHLRMYHAKMRAPKKRTTVSPGERWFCGACGTHLYVLDKNWPDGVWPNAGAIDTPLPTPPERVHLMTRYKPGWVEISDDGPRFPEYPELSIAEWHEQHGLTQKSRARKTARGKRAATK